MKKLLIALLFLFLTTSCDTALVVTEPIPDYTIYYYPYYRTYPHYRPYYVQPPKYHPVYPPKPPKQDNRGGRSTHRPSQGRR